MQSKKCEKQRIFREHIEESHLYAVRRQHLVLAVKNLRERRMDVTTGKASSDSMAILMLDKVLLLPTIPPIYSVYCGCYELLKILLIKDLKPLCLMAVSSSWYFFSI